MLELVHRPQVAENDRHLPDGVRAFLMASERRIIVHCQSLLERHGLSGEERQRLMRLAREAEEELQRLDGQLSKNFA
jgi:hypothetical protein